MWCRLGFVHANGSCFLQPFSELTCALLSSPPWLPTCHPSLVVVLMDEYKDLQGQGPSA